MSVGHLLRVATVLPVLLTACSNTRTAASRAPAATAQHEPVTVDTAHPAQAAPPTTSVAQSASSNEAAPAGTASSTTASEVANVEAAVFAAESWLKLVDSAKYDESWKNAASLFQRAMSEAEWSTIATKVLTPLGKVRSRHLRSTAYETALPGAPAGKYVVIRFDATFENKAGALETVTPMQGEDGAWKVAGYFVK